MKNFLIASRNTLGVAIASSLCSVHATELNVKGVSDYAASASSLTVDKQAEQQSLRDVTSSEMVVVIGALGARAIELDPMARWLKIDGS